MFYDAWHAIDLNTIVLLLGMMIVVANVHLSGSFRWVTNAVMVHVRHPFLLLNGVALTSGVFSAILVNDAICLMLTPLVLEVALRLQRNPVPYLLAVAMASNVGSTATLTGNPQNIFISSVLHIAYTDFIAALAPIAAIGIATTVILIGLFYPDEFQHNGLLNGGHEAPHLHHGPALKTALVTLANIAGFFAGQPPAKVALVAAAILLLTRRVKSEKVYREIDGPLLLMFVGLFIVVAGLERAALSPSVFHAIGQLHLERMPMLTLVTAALSNIVSNVPAMLILKPFVSKLHDPQRAWMVVAMAATLAGNFTVLDSIANQIVVLRAWRGIGFWEYFKVGAPLTVLTLLTGLALL